MLLSTAREEQGGGGAIGEALEQLSEQIASLRALITDLRPAVLDDFGVVGALETLAQRMSRQGVEVDLDLELAWETGRTPVRHTPELEIAIYRIVQESLNNAVRHGAATKAVVEVLEDDAVVRLVVRDNGAGFDPSARTAGFGVLGMRERAQLLDGDLHVESAPGEGTTVTATLPAVRLPLQDEHPDARTGTG
jgi:signal transduction histidine kinase